uniref:Uncharacterized protein n=1 Tax=Rhizophora mucronata TaxID=61149 RepID=A0A2P2KTU0_RHIMU
MVTISGQISCNKSSLNQDLLCECLPSSCESAEVGCRKAQEVDQNNTDEHTKKTIFGVEISATNHVESATASDRSFLQPLSCQSCAAYPESSSFSSWKKQAKTLRQNLITLNGNPGFSNSNKSSAIFINGPDLISDISLSNFNARSVPSIEAEFSYPNVLPVACQLDSKESKVNPSSSVFGCSSCISNSVSVSEKVPINSPTNGFMMNAKSTKELNMNAAPPRQYQNQATFDSSHASVDCLRKEINTHGGLSWHSGTSFGNGKSNVPHQMDLDCLQNYCQQSVNKGTILKDFHGNVIQDSLSMSNAHDAGDKRIEVGDCSSKSKILGVPILVKPILKDIPSANFPSKPNLFDSKTNVTASRKSGTLDTDLNYEPMLSESGMDSGITQNTDNHITGLRAVDCNDNARSQIDLNVNVTEEEAELAQSLPVAKLKNAVEIDLEVPVVIETEIDCTSGGKLPESKVRLPLDLLKNESTDFEEGLIKHAAEALVAISSSSVHDFVDNATNLQFGCALNDSLQWFAEIITSHKFEMENDMGSVTVVDEDGTGQDNAMPKGMDFFEYMTLSLRETKVEECHYEPQALENAKHETALLKRPRRVQARRGRQHKDFQRDVLPGLASLSRSHVTEDLQTIEGLIRATGGAWQSALLQRNSPKNKGGRGRKRSRSSATPPRVTKISPHPPQQLECGELGLEEVSKLAGWGKRTRRPPRQRCPINHHIVAVQ